MTLEKEVVLGVVGGSGLYKMEGIEVVREHDIDTPFGKPSDVIVEARYENRRVFFLPRHAKGHRLTPTEIPFRANVTALKQVGVTHLLAVSAVGIMQKNIRPGDMVVPDQIIDMTKGLRPSSFFEKGAAGHVMFADPFCEQLRELVISAAKVKAKNVHKGGTYVCIEGPRFSSRAESEYYRRTMEPSVIGMTAMPEAPLAREAELSYAMLALATDYDCWHEEEENVSVESVLRVVKENAETANGIVFELLKNLPEKMPALYDGSAKQMLITGKEHLTAEKKSQMEKIYGYSW